MLLDSRQFPIQVSELASESSLSVLVASAFIKKNALLHILGVVKTGIDLTVISRWRLEDLLSGASDLESYQLCRDRGVKFGMSLDFHGKLYLIDSKELFVGSANLTSRGFAIGSASNIEFGTRFAVTPLDLQTLDRFIQNEVTWLDDTTYGLISTEVERIGGQYDFGSKPKIEWSSSVLDILRKPVLGLWMEDLLFNAPSTLLSGTGESELMSHDLELLEIYMERYGNEELIGGFRQTKFFQWLVRRIDEKPGINIGGLSAKLHDALLDDPVPYRRDVKSMIVNAFSWLELMPDEFTVTQHNRTKSVARI